MVGRPSRLGSYDCTTGFSYLQYCGDVAGDSGYRRGCSLITRGDEGSIIDCAPLEIAISEFMSNDLERSLGLQGCRGSRLGLAVRTTPGD